MSTLIGKQKDKGYFGAMLRVLMLDERVYSEIDLNGNTVRYGMINIFLLGIFYGFFSMAFMNVKFSPDEFPNPESVLTVRIIVIIVGILIAFLLHLGGVMLLWTFGRGVGGTARFLPTYYNLGIAVVPLWLAVPGLAAVNAGWGGELVYLFAACTSVYAMASFFIATKNIFNLSFAKTALAMVMMLIFVSGFLYLWL